MMGDEIKQAHTYTIHSMVYRNHEKSIIFILLGYLWQLWASKGWNFIMKGDEIKQAHTYAIQSIVSRDHENSIIFILLGYFWQLWAPKGRKFIMKVE